MASRRRALGLVGWTTVTILDSTIRGDAMPSSMAMAAEPPRQLELCLVSVLRVVYWAEGLSTRMRDSIAAGSMGGQREAYLEARLGAKAILNSGITGGGNLLGTAPSPTAAKNIYILSTLQLSACLRDLQMVHNTQLAFANTCRDFRESLASLVEFDGMDTLQDPSPRSSLTLSQWNDKKNLFVTRLLQERVVVLGNAIVQPFPRQAQQTSRDYIQRYYSNEVLLQVGEA